MEGAWKGFLVAGEAGEASDQDFDLVDEIRELNLQVRLWASQRSQTLGPASVLVSPCCHHSRF